MYGTSDLLRHDVCRTLKARTYPETNRRERSKDRELREPRKQMSEYDNKLASIMDKIGKAENDISAANDVTRRRQQHQPQEMNEFYERVKANPKLLLEMFPHEMRSAQQEQS